MHFAPRKEKLKKNKKLGQKRWEIKMRGPV